MTNSTSNLLKRFEYLFSIFALAHMSKAVTELILTGGASEGDGVNITALDLSINAKISLLVYFVTIVLLVMRWKRVVSAVSRNWPLLILIGVVCFSYFWSINQDQTLRFTIYALSLIHNLTLPTTPYV